MAEFPALPLWTDAYLSDTRHLSCEQHGAYLLLLMEAWRRPSCSLPNDDEVLARLACLNLARWMEIRDVVMAFWKYDGRRKEWHQLRLDDERSYVAKKRSSQRHKAAKRWDKTKKDDAAAMPEGMPEACPDDAPTPTPFREEDKSSSPLSGTDVPDDVPAKSSRKTYPADFEAAWLAYPTTRNMSKAEALPEWRKLSVEDRAAVLQSIPGYIQFLKTKPDLETIHFVRYLKKRRFDGFVEAASSTATDWPKVLRFCRDNSQWSTAEWGAPPGHPACQIPKHLLLPDDGVGWSEWKPNATTTN